MEHLLERRSCRAFQPTTITQKQIDQIVLAGMSAPSSFGKYPVHFLTVTDKKDLEFLSTLNEYSTFTKDAACVVIICVDQKAALDYGHQETFATIDGGVALQNILTASKIQGFDVVCCGTYPMENLMGPIRKHFGIPDDISVFNRVVIGKKSDNFKYDADYDNKYDAKKQHTGKW
ncbi:Nitroreductase [Spironucleus salmonicida]|uniref:Nitroreductase n=1 Tax=Spironucleus salmonicida TaxID=348837 RepID=V6LC59_9EUKA|nr:Nitroreductase [Spironucleus salmonicida]|eukprot:EST41818.1 Nitroreductase [Spironucleus salmonicida]